MNETKTSYDTTKFDSSSRPVSSSMLELESLAKSTLDEAALQIMAFTKKAGEVIKKNPVATAAIVAVLGYAIIRLTRREPSSRSETLHH